MSLSTGETLGPYEILSKIGAGGMGEVYRARDTRLGREVAIKVSADRFNERFEREAKLIASLNHHNICSLFDVGPNFLVMELVEGATLAERIAEGPIPVEEALHTAAQIAEALQSAHDNGIIHRDLKPANIKIKPDGTVKVLDFGLAKMGSTTESGSVAPSDSPTLSIAATQAGMILGTAAYMSPEQARGKPVDKRADIWAFGAVLYEMITGKQLFRGEDVSETLASVIMKEPDLDPVPLRVRRVLKRCLEKDPKKRLRDISGVALLLEHESAVVSAVRQPSRTSWMWPAVCFAALLAAAVMGWEWYRARATAPPPLKPLVRLNVDIGATADFSSSSLTGADLMLSPDAQRIAYIAQSHLYTQRLDSGVATELAGTDGVYSAFFSPDGRWLGFLAGGQLKKVSVDGGAVVALSASFLGRGGTWGEDGYITVSLSSNGGLSRVKESGGTPVDLTHLAAGEATHRFPFMVPGGKAVIYTAHSGTSGFDGAVIKLHSFVDGKSKIIHQGGTYGRVVQTQSGQAYLLFVSRGTLFAKPFDLDRLETSGDPVPILDGLGTAPQGSADIDISKDGIAVFRNLNGSGLTLQWLNVSGKTEPLISKPAIYGRPAVSPQGDRVAVEVYTATTSDIWLYDVHRDNMSRLTFSNGNNASAVWSPDGRYLVFQELGGMAWIRSDGGASQSLTKSKSLQFPWSISSDGKHLGYMEAGLGGYDLWTVPLEGDVTTGIHAGTPEVFVKSEFDERSPTFSPDGHWIAYHANEGGAFEVYVRAFPDKGRKWQISNGGGTYPSWSRTGHDLIFETLDAHIMSAPYSVTNDSFVADRPKPWSSKTIVNSVNSIKNFDLAPDGKRIAALMPAAAPEAGAQTHVTFLLNFLDELERRVPVKK